MIVGVKPSNRPAGYPGVEFAEVMVNRTQETHFVAKRCLHFA